MTALERLTATLLVTGPVRVQLTRDPGLPVSFLYIEISDLEVIALGDINHRADPLAEVYLDANQVIARNPIASVQWVVPEMDTEQYLRAVVLGPVNPRREVIAADTLERRANGSSAIARH
jgi:hypothetical protein